MIFLIFIFLSISYIVPHICYIFIPITLYLIFHYYFSSKSSLKKKKILLVFAILIFLRILGFLIGFYIVTYSTPPPKTVNEVFKRCYLLYFTANADVGTFETQFILRRRKTWEDIEKISQNSSIIESIKQNSRTSGTLPQNLDMYDGFNGYRWIKKGNVINLYSIGADQEDNFADIRYSPTNGTCSRGDLIYLIDIGNEDNRDSISPVNSIKSP